jgi:menaquinone-dependent protoporphyrinogen oxidase
VTGSHSVGDGIWQTKELFVARILVAYDTIEGQTEKIAQYIGRRAREQGHEVVVENIVGLSPEGVSEAYDGLIVGASIHVGRHSAQFVEFIEDRRMWLEGMPVAFFSVSLSASGDEAEREEAQGYVRALLRETGWQPQETATIGGGLRYRRYGFLKRLIMRRIARRSGRDVDTSKDHEYTNWEAVDRFAEGFLAQFR